MRVRIAPGALAVTLGVTVHPGWGYPGDIEGSGSCGEHPAPPFHVPNEGAVMHQLNGAWFEFTQHALIRAADMALDEDAIRETLGNPRHVQERAEGKEIWTRGKLSAVVRPQDGVWLVVTFMWATANAWAMDRETVHSRKDPLDRDRDRAMRYSAKMRKRGRNVR